MLHYFNKEDFWSSSSDEEYFIRSDGEQIISNSNITGDGEIIIGFNVLDTILIY